MTPYVDPEIRFMRFVDKQPNGCWQWTGNVIWSGYSKFWFDGRTVAGHRWSYEHFVGPVPNGLQIDHLCRNRTCVNPGHLEAVTPRTNVLRGNTPAAANAAKTHCPRGHAYSAENTVEYGSGRMCRTCGAERSATNRKRNADQLRSDPSSVRHGNPWTYSNHRCRCDGCRAAWSTYLKNLRKKATSCA